MENIKNKSRCCGSGGGVKSAYGDLSNSIARLRIREAEETDADLLVSRAGASTISEITAIGLPTILVPSPYVTHNHQYLNAKDLEDVGACKIVEEKDFSSEKLIPVIDEVINDTKLYRKMSDNSFKFGVRDSATRIYEEIRKLIGE